MSRAPCTAIVGAQGGWVPHSLSRTLLLQTCVGVMEVACSVIAGYRKGSTLCVCLGAHSHRQLRLSLRCCPGSQEREPTEDV